MEDKKYIAKDVEFSLGIRIHDWWTAIRRRKDTLKSFCHNVNIDYPIDATKKYHFPKEYCIKDAEIEYLARNRDKIILAVFEEYKQAQNTTMKELLALKENLKTENEYLKEEKEHKLSLQNTYKSEKDTIQKLALQADINNVKASIKNCESTISGIEANIEVDRLLLGDNQKSWKNQVDIVGAAFDNQTKRFVLSATMKIRKKLNFTDFYYNRPDHTKEVKKIIEGELYE